MTIKDFFKKLNNDIKSSRTEMSLKILEERANKSVKEVLENDMISNLSKAEAKRNLKRSLFLIKSMKKRVKA